MGKNKIMKGMSSKEKEILQTDNELQFPTDRLGAGSLMIQQNRTNASRTNMVNHQITHMVSPKEPEMPLEPSGFENILASFSSMLDKTDGDYTIVAKFEKNAYNYVLIGFDKKRKLYHAWKRVELEEHSEGCSTRYDNKYMDSLEIGDVVPKNEYIKKSTNFDKYMNYCYGVNFNTVYLISTKVYEDGITIMNGAENMLNTFNADTIQIGINDNDILLNWYGDDKHYQGIPNIGEKTRDGILAVVRRIDNSKAPYSLKKKRLRQIERGDRRYFGSGRVIDINILYNKELKDIPDVGATKVIKELYAKQQKYYLDLYRYMHNIVDNASDNNYSYTDEFTIICEEAHSYVDPATFFVTDEESIYGNIQIVFKLMDDKRMTIGSKMVGRSGNKGVISKIIPPERSWCMEDGTPIHIMVSTLGIVNRLNPSQMNEHSINELSATAIDMMKLTDDLSEKGTIVYKLMKELNPDEAYEFKKFYKNLDKKEKAKYCRNLERNGIRIVQDPIENANIVDIGNAYKKFPANWRRIRFEDGELSMNKVLCSKMFFMRLKQDPIEKYSARSRGPINPLTTTSSKSNNKKKHLEPYSDVPVRLGEIELEVLFTMINHYQAVARYMRENSTSWYSKLKTSVHNYLGDVYTDDDDDDYEYDVIDDMINSLVDIEPTSKNTEAIEAYLYILGTAIEAEIEQAPEGEYFLD